MRDDSFFSATLYSFHIHLSALYVYIEATFIFISLLSFEREKKNIFSYETPLFIFVLQ